MDIWSFQISTRLWSKFIKTKKINRISISKIPHGFCISRCTISIRSWSMTRSSPHIPHASIPRTPPQNPSWCIQQHPWGKLFPPWPFGRRCTLWEARYIPSCLLSCRKIWYRWIFGCWGESSPLGCRLLLSFLRHPWLTSPCLPLFKHD